MDQDQYQAAEQRALDAEQRCTRFCLECSDAQLQCEPQELRNLLQPRAKGTAALPRGNQAVRLFEQQDPGAALGNRDAVRDLRALVLSNRLDITDIDYVLNRSGPAPGTAPQAAQSAAAAGQAHAAAAAVGAGPSAASAAGAAQIALGGSEPLQVQVVDSNRAALWRLLRSGFVMLIMVAGASVIADSATGTGGDPAVGGVPPIAVGEVLPVAGLTDLDVSGNLALAEEPCSRALGRGLLPALEEGSGSPLASGRAASRGAACGPGELRLDLTGTRPFFDPAYGRWDVTPHALTVLRCPYSRVLEVVLDRVSFSDAAIPGLAR
ncbi:unnamed protein product, partial [Prorocentrum cordatum]